MSGTLYLVGTPIGNLGDITLRAIETLKTVDVIACEDTRHTLALLNKLEIKKPLISYYRQKEREGSEEITNLLLSGKNVALVTDAGMPCISDPGSILVKKLFESGLSYTVVPGASAFVSAIALTGVIGTFTFLGFLPEKRKDYQALLEQYKCVNTVLLIYSAPHDVNDTIRKCGEILGNRSFYAVKEITKIYEYIIKGRLCETAIETPKGEYVLVIEPNEESEKPIDESSIKETLLSLINSGVNKKDAVKEVALSLNVSKNLVYKISLTL